MRIIGGKYRGRILKEFDGKEVRPTSDRAREALFNIFASHVPGCEFLDLFAGSGAVGIEAISRGASEVTFTDLKKQSVALIKSNLSLIKENAVVLLTDGIEFLKTTEKKYDFIFIDPPYDSSLGETALKVISRKSLLKEGGYAVFESDGEYSEEFSTLEKISSRKYGKNHFNIYRKVKDD